MVRPKFLSVSVRACCASASNSPSDLGEIKSAKRWRSCDFCSGRLSKSGAKDIAAISLAAALSQSTCLALALTLALDPVAHSEQE
jgi:hypothetical protein